MDGKAHALGLAFLVGVGAIILYELYQGLSTVGSGLGDALGFGPGGVFSAGDQKPYTQQQINTRNNFINEMSNNPGAVNQPSYLDSAESAAASYDPSVSGL